MAQLPPSNEAWVCTLCLNPIARARDLISSQPLHTRHGTMQIGSFSDLYRRNVMVNSMRWTRTPGGLDAVCLFCSGCRIAMGLCFRRVTDPSRRIYFVTLLAPRLTLVNL